MRSYNFINFVYEEINNQRYVGTCHEVSQVASASAISMPIYNIHDVLYCISILKFKNENRNDFSTLVKIYRKYFEMF